MTIVATLAPILLVGIAIASDPEALVRQLGSSRYAEREEAAAELERLGRDALPALRAARQDRDPEVRARAVALFDRIEGALLTRPSLIRLDFQDRPLLEVIQAMNRQSGAGLALVPENNPAWATRSVTLAESEPLPFWKAVDRLCEAASLQYNFGFQVMPGRAAVLPLYDGNGRAAGRMVDSGPFRVALTSLHYSHDVHFGAGSSPMALRRGRVAAPIVAEPMPEVGHSSNEVFSFHLQIAAEPRLMVQQQGNVKLLEATDDLGQSLIAPNEGANEPRMSGYVGFNTVPVVQIQVSMARPEQPGKSIRKIKGIVPVAVSARKPDPLEIPIAENAGKTFRNEDAIVTLIGVKPHAGGAQSMIEVQIRPANGLPVGPDGGNQGIETLVPRQDLASQQRIEVLDGRGSPLPWFPSSTRVDQDGVRMTMILPANGQGKPDKIRYHAMIWATADVPFEFRDLPMP